MSREPIRAAQLIYTNVEADQSPWQRGGYQTLLYTLEGPEALSQNEVIELESRLFYVPKGDARPQKHVFFLTRTRRVALARAIPLTGEDQFGRSGRYLAHALVLRSDVFRQLENDPFLVFQRFPFFQSVAEARGSALVPSYERGHIEPAELGIAAASGAAPVAGADLHAVLAPALLSFLGLAAQAARLREQRRAVGLYGPAGDCAWLLRELFAFLPVQQRLDCSFDTLFVEGSLSRQPYWAVGLPASEPRKPNLVTFAIAACCFDEPVPDTPATAYGRWLDSRPQRRVLDGSARVTSAAHAIGELIDRTGTADPALLAGADDALVRDLVRLNREQLEKQLNEATTALAGHLFGSSLRRHLAPGILDDPTGLLRYLQEGLDREQLDDWLYTRFARRPVLPEMQREVHELHRLAEEQHGSPAHLIDLRWSRRWDDLAAALDAADATALARFLPWALKTVPSQPDWLLHGDDSRRWLHYAPPPASALERAEAWSLLLALLGVRTADLAAASEARPKPERTRQGLRRLLVFGRGASATAASLVLRPRQGMEERWEAVRIWLEQRGTGRERRPPA